MEENKSMLRQNHDRLCQNLCLTEVIGILYQNGVLTLRQIQYIKKGEYPYKKNERFLKEFNPTPEFWNAFIVSLRETCQGYLADDLEPTAKKTLRENINTLAEKMDVDRILPIMYQNGISTDVQHNELIKVPRERRNVAFLNRLLFYYATKSFEYFVSALIETDQEELALLLDPIAIGKLANGEGIEIPNKEEYFHTNIEPIFAAEECSSKNFSFEFKCFIAYVIFATFIGLGLYVYAQRPMFRASISEQFTLFRGTLPNRGDCAGNINFNGNNRNELLCTAKNFLHYNHGRITFNVAVLHIDSLILDFRVVAINYGPNYFPAQNHTHSKVTCRIAHMACNGEGGQCDNFAACCTPYGHKLRTNDTYCNVQQQKEMVVTKFKMEHISYPGGPLTPFSYCPIDFDKCFHVLDTTRVLFDGEVPLPYYKRQIRLIYDASHMQMKHVALKGESLLAFTAFSTEEIGTVTINTTTGQKNIFRCYVNFENMSKPHLFGCDHISQIAMDGFTAEDFLLGRFMKSDGKETYFVAKFLQTNELLIKTSDLETTIFDLSKIASGFSSTYKRFNQLIINQQTIFILYCSDIDHQCGRVEIDVYQGWGSYLAAVIDLSLIICHVLWSMTDDCD